MKLTPAMTISSCGFATVGASGLVFVLIVTRRVFVVLPFLWLCTLFKRRPKEFFKILYHLDIMFLKINKIFLYRKNNLLIGDHRANHVFSVSLKFLLDVIILQLNSCGHKNKNDHIRRIMHYYMAISVLSSVLGLLWASMALVNMNAMKRVI